MASSSQVSVKHRAADLEKSLFVQESRRSLSVLSGREQRFARWMLGNGVLNLRWRSFTSTPARFPCLRVLKLFTRAMALRKLQCPAKRPNNLNPVKYFVVFCRMFSSSSLVKLIVFEKQKQEKQTKTLHTLKSKALKLLSSPPSC